MTPEKQLEMWNKLHGLNKTIYDERLEKLSDKLAHFYRARKIVAAWPKWKQECAYSTTSDRYSTGDKS